MVDYKGTREAFCEGMLASASDNDSIIFVSADSVKAARMTKFIETYPERYVEAGIAEQNAVAMSAGLAACGFTPFVSTYAGFITMRACEQMRTFVAYPKLNVKFVGLNAGLIGGEREGVTHQFYEDIGIVSSIPGITIFTPADAGQMYHAVMEAAKVDGPVYIRAGSGREPEVYDRNAPFNMEGSTVLREYGTDAVIFSSGFVLDRVLSAAEKLNESGVRVTVADVNIIKHKDTSRIVDLLKKCGKAVTVEDHNVYGGLGSYIAKISVENHPVGIRMLGLQNVFPESGPAAPLADKYGLSVVDITKGVLDLILADTIE